VVLYAWCEGGCLTVRPKHVELILKINKHCYLSHLVGLDFITLPNCIVSVNKFAMIF
jgi:hypothetical protein